MDQSKKVRFQQTHNQSLRQMFLTAFWDIRVVPEGTHEASRGPLKGNVSAQKALQQRQQNKGQGSCREERKRIVFPWQGVICLPGKSKITYKKETEKIQLVARLNVDTFQPVVVEVKHQT